MAILAQAVKCFLGSRSLGSVMTRSAGTLVNAIVVAGCTVCNCPLMLFMVKADSPFFVFKYDFGWAVAGDGYDAHTKKSYGDT